MTYKEIYDNLQNGCYYYDDGLSCEITVLYLSISGYINWRCFGSSAGKNTLEELTWIIDNIFELTPDEFAAKYKLGKWNR